MKKCRECEEWLEDNLFSPNRRLCKKCRNKQSRNYLRTPEAKKKKKEYLNRPEVKEYVTAYAKAYNQKPEVKKANATRSKNYRERLTAKLKAGKKTNPVKVKVSRSSRVLSVRGVFCPGCKLIECDECGDCLPVVLFSENRKTCKDCLEKKGQLNFGFSERKKTMDPQTKKDRIEKAKKWVTNQLLTLDRDVEAEGARAAALYLHEMSKTDDQLIFDTFGKGLMDRITRLKKGE